MGYGEDPGHKPLLSHQLSTTDLPSSGDSTPSINNPKLLDDVENAIRRLILPELTSPKNSSDDKQRLEREYSEKQESPYRDALPNSEDIFSVDSESDITSPTGISAFHRGNASSITSFNAPTNKSRRPRISKSFKHRHPSQLRAGTSHYASEERDPEASTLLSELNGIVGSLRRPLPARTLRVVSKILKAALDDVQERLEHSGGGIKSTWAGSTMAGEDFSLDHPEPMLSYTPLLDEYLDKVGDLDLARERYESFLLQVHGWLKEEADRQQGLGQSQGFENSAGNELNEDEGWEAKNKLELVRGIQKAFMEVQILEQKCIEENSLHLLRDLHENFELVLDPTGNSEVCSFLKPSPHWHERLNAGEFKIQRQSDIDLPLPPTPPPPPQDLPLPPTPPPPSLTLQLSSILSPHDLPLPPTPPPPSLSPTETANQVDPHSLPTEPSPWIVPVREILQAALAQEMSLGVYSDTDIHHVTYEIAWELPIFFAAHMAPGTLLGSCLTVTGGAIDAFATSCREYVTIFWQEAGLLLLDAVENILKVSPKEAHTLPTETKNDRIRISISQDADTAQKLSSMTFQRTPIQDKNSYMSWAKIESRAKFSDQLDIAATLRWLCSAVRHSPDGLKLSTVSVSYDRTAPSAKLIISPNLLVDRNYEDSCWHALFKHQVIASEFPIPERKKGKGLEISYANMVTLARSLELVEIHDSLVAEGLNTLLIPTLRLDQADEDAVQWHLVMKPKLEVLRPETFDSLLPASWYKELDHDLLSSRRAFLGWTPSAVVTLGTAHSNTKLQQIRPSGLSEIDKLGLAWERGGEVALNIKVITVTGTATATPSSITSAIAMEDGVTIDSRLRNAAERRHVILYDNETEVAWHISRASLILYLAQVNIAHRREQSGTSKIFAEPSANGGIAALHAIRSGWLWDIPDEKHAIEKLARPKQLSWLIKRIVFRIQKVEEALMKTQTEAFKVGKRPPKSIIGVELLDVAYFQERVSIKEKEVNQAWAHLTDQEPLVFFCRGLGQVIQPFPSQYHTEALCRDWTVVHEKANYFVATSTTIMRLFESNSSKGIPRLSKSIQWTSNPKHPLFTLHKYDEPSACNHLQKLKATESVDKESESRIANFVEKNVNAAFIFWDGSKKLLKTAPITVRRPLEQIQPHASTSRTVPASAQLPLQTSTIRSSALRTIRESPAGDRNNQSSNIGQDISVNNDKFIEGPDNSYSRLPISHTGMNSRGNESQYPITTERTSLISRSHENSSSKSRSLSPASSNISREDNDFDLMSSHVVPIAAPSMSFSGATLVPSLSRETTMSIVSGSATLRPSSGSLRSSIPDNGRTSPRTLRREVRKIPSIQESNIAMTIPTDQKVSVQPTESHRKQSMSNPLEAPEQETSNRLARPQERVMNPPQWSENHQTDSGYIQNGSERQKEKVKQAGKPEVRGRREELPSGRRRKHSKSTSTSRDQNRQQEKGKQDKGKKTSWWH